MVDEMENGNKIIIKNSEDIFFESLL